METHDDKADRGVDKLEDFERILDLCDRIGESSGTLRWAASALVL